MLLDNGLVNKVGSIESIKLMEEPKEWSTKDRGAEVNEESNSPFKAVWLSGVQINGQVQQVTGECERPVQLVNLH